MTCVAAARRLAQGRWAAKMSLRYWSIALLVIALGAGCGVGRPVEIIVVNGFVGEAQVVFDPVHGVPLSESGFHFVARIPLSGELRVNDVSPFYRWHSSTVRYENGTKANVVREYSEAATVSTGSGKWQSSTDLPGSTLVWVIAAPL